MMLCDKSSCGFSAEPVLESLRWSLTIKDSYMCVCPRGVITDKAIDDKKWQN